MGKGEDVERKGFDINSFQGDPSWGWEGFLLPSVHTEEGGVCAPNAGDHGRFQSGVLVPPCWNLQMLQCSQARGDGCTQGLG